MPTVTLYHNPRCSKSRSALAILQERGVSPEVVLYLETPLDAAEIRSLLDKLEKTAAEIVRRGEDEYRAAGLDAQADEASIIAAIVRYPRLLERPIAVCGERAVIGRPPENVLDLLT
ncbi:MAG: arsenate reductase (glutaredoxin) [Halioglobus sp.]